MLQFLAMLGLCGHSRGVPWRGDVERQWGCRQETRMLSQALNRAMPHSRNQLEKGVNILLAVHCIVH